MELKTGDGYGGYGYGDGYGSGSGDYGDGSGSGSGYGSGSGDGYGDGCGYGYSYGNSGSGNGYDHKHGVEYAQLISDQLTLAEILIEPNLEFQRVLLEAAGPDKLFATANRSIIHQDIDGCGNPRTLARISVPHTKHGYLQGVYVACPTTDRRYWLSVPSTVTTCQEAVAATFGLRADEYRPERES